MLRHRASSGTGTPGIRVGGPTDPSMTRQGQVQGQVPDKEGGKEGGTREVARRAPTKSIARVPAVEKSGWNDDSSTGHLEGQINEGSLDLDSRHANTQHSDMSTAQSTYADSRSVQRDSTVTQSNRSSSLPLHRQSQNSHDSRTIPLNANDQKMKSEISKLENELENSSNSSKKMQIRREITSMKAKLGVRE